MLLFMVIAHGVWAQEKLAQTGMQFLSVTPDARAAAMGDAMTTVENYSSALFSNPAMLTERGEMIDVMFSQNNWIADIRHNAIGLAYRPAGGVYGVFAVSVMAVDYGEIEGTIISNNELGYLETGMISPNAYAIGIGYARSLSEKFSIGGQIKYVNQNLGPAAVALYNDPYSLKMVYNDISVFGFDFGTIYKTGYKSLAFGMSVRNFSKEIVYNKEGFQLPMVFSIGVSMNLAELFPEEYRSEHLLFTVDAIHPRSHYEQVKLGLEYTYLELLSLRAGFISDADEQAFTYGIGIQQFGLVFDYAYTPFGVFDKVQRFTLRFAM